MGACATRKLKLYQPHEKQLAFHQSTARFRVASLGRQAGKSTMAMNELIFKAWTNPNTRYWFISPIYSQAKDMYRKASNYLPPEVIARKSDTELRIELITGSAIEYKSGEVLDRLRGATLHGVVIDEVRDQHRDLWPLVIRPMLATTQGWAAFISTPRGMDLFYDLFNMRDSNKDWASFHAPSTCNPLITQAEVDQARTSMSEDEFAQEILAEFREFGRGKVYTQHGAHNHSERNPLAPLGMKWNPYLPIIVGLDFNVGHMSWLFSQYRGGEFYIGDEIFIKNTNTEQCALVLIQKVRDHKPGITLIGDASGNSNKTSASGKTDYSILMKAIKEAGIPVTNKTPEANPHIKDRVNMVNSRLKSADGSIHLWYNPKTCPALKKDLERVTWKENASGAIFDTKDPSLTHMSDGLGYVVSQLSPEWKPKPGGIHVISR